MGKGQYIVCITFVDIGVKKGDLLRWTMSIGGGETIFQYYWYYCSWSFIQRTIFVTKSTFDSARIKLFVGCYDLSGERFDITLKLLRLIKNYFKILKSHNKRSNRVPKSLIEFEQCVIIVVNIKFNIKHVLSYLIYIETPMNIKKVHKNQQSSNFPYKAKL